MISKTLAAAIAERFGLESLNYATADGGGKLKNLINAFSDHAPSEAEAIEAAKQIRQGCIECPTYSEVCAMFLAPLPEIKIEPTKCNRCGDTGKEPVEPVERYGTIYPRVSLWCRECNPRRPIVAAGHDGKAEAASNG